MKFNLQLDERMCLTTDSDFVVRQGSHYVDTMEIHLNGQYQGMSGYFEFDLPHERKHISHVITIGDVVCYDIPAAVTEYYGIAKVQLVMLNEGGVYKSSVLSFEISPSISSAKHYDEKDKRDFFADMVEVKNSAIAETNKCANATNNALKSTKDMNTLKNTIEQKLINGEFDGNDGEPGRTPNISISKDNGCWEIDGVDTGVKAQGPKGDTGSIDDKAIISKGNANWSMVPSDTIDVGIIPAITKEKTQYNVTCNGYLYVEFICSNSPNAEIQVYSQDKNWKYGCPFSEGVPNYYRAMVPVQKGDSITVRINAYTDSTSFYSTLTHAKEIV